MQGLRAADPFGSERRRKSLPLWFFSRSSWEGVESGILYLTSYQSETKGAYPTAFAFIVPFNGKENRRSRVSPRANSASRAPIVLCIWRLRDPRRVKMNTQVSNKVARAESTRKHKQNIQTGHRAFRIETRIGSKRRPPVSFPATPISTVRFAASARALSGSRTTEQVPAIHRQKHLLVFSFRSIPSAEPLQAFSFPLLSLFVQQRARSCLAWLPSVMAEHVLD